MSVFLSTKLNDFTGSIIKLEWHPRLSLLAVALQTQKESGEIAVSSLQSLKYKDTSIIRAHGPTCISWHPLDCILVVGWDNGCVTACLLSENNTFDISFKLEATITSLVWSPDGRFLLVTDTNGAVCIFLYVKRNNFGQKPIRVSNINSSISYAIPLSTLNHRRDESFSLDDKFTEPLHSKVSPKLSTHFGFYLVGSDDGRITCVKYDNLDVNETSACTMNNLVCCEGCILRILYHEIKRTLLIITDKGLLYHYHVKFSSELSVKEVAKMKLSSGLCHQPSITWAGEATLAMGLGETVVRLWDIERSDNYTLTPNVSHLEKSKKSVKVLQVAYSETYRVLAAGLSNGMVAFWQYGTELNSHDDLFHLLQSDSNLTQSCDNRQDISTLYNCANNVIEKAPEANWHPQPSAILTSQQNGEFASLPLDPNQNISLLTWGEREKKLAIALLPHHSNEKTTYSHSIQVKSSVHILQRQSLCTHFYGSGCVVVQTGSQSFSMLTSIPDSVTPASPMNVSNNLPSILDNTDINKGSTSTTKVANLNNLPASFITTSIPIMVDKSKKQNSKFLIDQKKVTLYEHEAQVEDQIKAIFCTQEHVAYWNGHRISVFKHSTGNCITHLISFACEFRFVGMHQQNIFTVEPYKLQVRNLEGCVRQLINFTETEGSITLTSQCANYMACLTDQNKIRVLDLSRREVKSTDTSKSLTKLFLCEILNQISQNSTTSSLYSTKTFQKNLSLLQNPNDAIMSELNISWISINKSGGTLAFTVEILRDGILCNLLWPCLDVADQSSDTLIESESNKMNEQCYKEKSRSTKNEEEEEDVLKQWIPDPNIFIYHLDVDKLKCFNFFEAISNSLSAIPGTISVSESDLHPTSLDLIRLNSTNLIQGRWPKHHYWDQFESRLLVVEASPIPDDHPIITSRLNAVDKMNKQCGDVIYTTENDTDQYTYAGSRSSSKVASITPEIASKGQYEQSKVLTSIVSLFVSPEQNNIIVQGSFLMSVLHSALIGVEVPLIYFSVRCDLVYRVLNEQHQRRLEMLAASGRRVISEIDSTSRRLSTTVSTGINGLDSSVNTSSTDDDKGQHQVTSDVLSEGQITSNNRIHYVNRRVMQNFVGLEDADEKTREAMLNFSYYLAIGEMDSAFRAMKLIKSPTVWQNMARMCVTTCRLDVARVCLGKISNPMASKMIRESRFRELEIEAQAGELALQLGMPDEAERLFIQCNRWDLVIRLHQSLGNWNKAITTAEQHHRMSLRGIHYSYAKELESTGQIKQAIEHYIKSETYRFEVPRMLKSNPELLESFVTSQTDQSIKRWWAQTLEAQGRLEEAKRYYFESKDYLSLVRVLCCLGQESEAEAICNETGDAGACHHLARHLEPKGGIDQAIRLFTRAKAYSSAIRLCKEHNRNDHLFSLAQLGRPDDMLESAKHLEKYPNYAGKAVLLYHKAGKINRAVELAFSTRQFSALQSVAGSLDERIDPTMLKQCSEFFIQNNQFDRAVEVLAAGKQYCDALKLCADHNVSISDELAEKLTPTSDKLPEKEKCSLLVELGELCMQQGKYHLACKKFTQAGSRISAMKALLRSGDTEKIIFFANVSKQKEIYIMAANYLQTVNDWRSNMNIIKNIIQFYSRGHALESLASFYEACAQGEIEDGGNYEKATGALSEAYKVLIKALNSDKTNESSECRLKKRLALIKDKATLCKEFVETQELFSVNPIEAMERCHRLLDTVEPGDLLRPGDIYSTMIRELVSQEKYKAALNCLDEMRERVGNNHTIARYLDRGILGKIYKALNLPSTENDDEQILKNEQESSDSPIFEDNVVDASISDENDDY